MSTKTFSKDCLTKDEKEAADFIFINYGHEILSEKLIFDLANKASMAKFENLAYRYQNECIKWMSGNIGLSRISSIRRYCLDKLCSFVLENYPENEYVSEYFN